MKLPFKQTVNHGKLIREFSKDVDSSELVWHRDKLDRRIYVKKGEGWMLQLENNLPVHLKPSHSYFIPKNTYHRVLKGSSCLIVEISEKIT